MSNTEVRDRDSLVVSNDIFFSEVIKFINEGKSVLFTIKGTSMLPFLKDRQKVVLEPVSDMLIKHGTIALAKSDYGIVLHRIVKIKGDELWLAGDGNLWQREKILRSNIIGVVRYAFLNEEKINIHTKKLHFFALLWYLARPFRIVVKKIKSLL